MSYRAGISNNESQLEGGPSTSENQEEAVAERRATEITKAAFDSQTSPQERSFAMSTATHAFKDNERTNITVSAPDVLQVHSLPKIMRRDFIHDIPEGMSKAADSPVWSTYVKESTKFDEKMFSKYDNSMDALLVFAALFSAVVTAFLIESTSFLQPDNTQATVDGLVAISLQLAGLSSTTANASSVFQTAPFVPSVGALWMNGLWFLSLAISLIVSIIAMLVKQWLRALSEGLSSEPAHHSRQRQFRYEGILQWRIPAIANSLPFVLHLAVFFFFSGIVIFLRTASLQLANLMSGVLGVSFGAYLLSAMIPLLEPNCPYHTPLTTFFAMLWRRSYWLLHKIWRESVHIQELGWIRIFRIFRKDLRVWQRQAFIWLYHELWFLVSQHLRMIWSHQVGHYASGAAREAALIHAQQNLLDLDAFTWLLAASTDQYVQEVAAFAFAGWDMTEPEWKKVGHFVHQAAHIAISTRITNQSLTKPSELAMLAAFASLHGLSPKYRLRNYELQSVIDLIKPRNTPQSLFPPLLETTILLYLGHQIDGDSDPTLIEVAPMHRHQEAISQLSIILTGTEIPIFACCLVLEYFRRTEDGSGSAPTLSETAELVPLLASFVETAVNVPQELLNAIFMYWETRMFRDPIVPPHHPDVQPPFCQWDRPFQEMALMYLGNTGIEAVAPCTIRATVLYILNNFPSFDGGYNPRAIEAIVKCLPSKPCPPNSNTTQSPATVPLHETSSGLTVLALAAINTLMSRSTALLEIPTVITLCHYLDIKSEEGLAFHKRLLNQNNVLGFHIETDSLELQHLLDEIHQHRDVRLYLAAIKVVGAVVLQARMRPERKAIGTLITKSGWLSMLCDGGLEYVLRTKNKQLRSLVTRTILRLALTHGVATLDSGVVETLQTLHQAHQIKPENFTVRLLQMRQQRLNRNTTLVCARHTWEVVCGYVVSPWRRLFSCRVNLSHPHPHGPEEPSLESGNLQSSHSAGLNLVPSK